MKKLLIFATTILILLFTTQFAFADSLDFNGGAVMIDIPDGSTAYIEAGDDEELNKLLEGHSLAVRSGDPDYLWYFYYINNEYTMNFTEMTDEGVVDLITNDSTEVDPESVRYEIYDNGNKYLVIDSVNEENGDHIHFYVTGVGKSIYYFVSESKGDELSQEAKADLRNIVDRVTYEKVETEGSDEQTERQAAMIRIFKRFAAAFIALAIFIVIKLGVEKMKEKRGK